MEKSNIQIRPHINIPPPRRIWHEILTDIYIMKVTLSFFQHTLGRFQIAYRALRRHNKGDSRTGGPQGLAHEPTCPATEQYVMS